MRKTDFWTSYGEAMQLAVEGDRLIALEIAHFARRLWQRAIRSFDGLIGALGHHGHYPTV